MRSFPRVALLALVLVAATLTPGAAEAKSSVVATLADLWAITRGVTADLIDVKLATRFGQNPHDMEIRPSQILLVKRADVLIRNGLEEDRWVDPLVEGSGNPRLLRGSPNVIEAVRGVRVLEVPTGPIDRSLGDIHPLGNPHYAKAPSNLPLVTASIVAGLSRIFPDLAPKLEANRQAFLDEVATAAKRWKETLAPFQGTKLVAYHKTWPYFYEEFGLVDGGTIEDRPGVPPSPQHVAALIRAVRQEKIKAILLETWYPADVPNYIAAQTGARVVVVPASPGAVKGTEDYIAWMNHLVTAVAKALA